MSDTAARLAEYRRKKQEAETQAKRKEALWNALTFAPLRRRLAASLAVAPEEQESIVVEGGEGEQDLEEEKEVIWTKLNWVTRSLKSTHTAHMCGGPKKVGRTKKLVD